MKSGKYSCLTSLVLHRVRQGRGWSHLPGGSEWFGLGVAKTRLLLYVLCKFLFAIHDTTIV